MPDQPLPALQGRGSEMAEEKKPTAFLEWGLYVSCPKCKEKNNLADYEHDPRQDIANRIFTNTWDKLKGWEVTCEHCGHEFTIEEVEY